MTQRRCYVLAALLVLCPLALTRHDDDFAFDSDEFQLELTANNSEITKNSLRRLWGVPDTAAYVGHLFRMEIPKEAFSGEVLAYKVRTEQGRRIPAWMAVDSKHGLISGVPMSGDVGTHAFTVTAHGRTAGLTATDSFVIEVKKADEKSQSKYGFCHGRQNKLMLMLLVDQPFSQIAPRNRIRALMELSHFMALDAEEFSISPYKMDKSSEHAVIMSGVGTSNKRRGDATTAIYLNVGCGETLWSRHKVLVAGVREQARDGTLAHLMRLPLLGWRLVAVKPLPRNKRQLPNQLSQLDGGSGGYEYDDDGGDDDDGDVNYSGYDEDYEDPPTDDNTPAPPVTLTSVPPVPLTPLTPQPTSPPHPAVHPHRHHHGEPPHPSPGFQTDSEPTSATSTTALITSTGAATSAHHTPEPETTTNALTTEDHKVDIIPFPESASAATNRESVSVNPRRFDSPVIIASEEPTTETDVQTVIIRASNEVPLPAPTTPRTVTVAKEETIVYTRTTPSVVPATIPTKVTTQSTIATELTTPSTIATEVTTPTTMAAEVTTPTTLTTVTTPSTTPLAVITPKMIIPVAATTADVPEMLTTTESVETTLPDDSSQENKITASTGSSSTIFGITTETVSFMIPTNQPPTLKHHMKKIAVVAGKAFRYIIPPDLFTDPEDGGNLTFTMYDSDNMPFSDNSWIQFIPKAREVYGLPLESHVSRWNFIVEAKDKDGSVARGPLDITVQQHKSARTFNHQFGIAFKLNKKFEHSVDWQISALEGIVNLFRDTDMDNLTVLNVTQNGDVHEFVWTNDTLPKDPACPKEDINRLLKILESPREPGRPSAALVRAMSPGLTVSAVWGRGAGPCGAPAPPPAAPAYPPVTRNQVDYVHATPGHLLVYTVPEDTFYDPEDGGTRNLHLSLRNNDRSELLTSDWLQFDANNQEFYGLPSTNDIGSKMYQLVAEDSSKKSAYDSLIVEVVKAPPIKPTVEFQMTLEYPYGQIANSASVKRKVVEKLAALFGQKKTESIRIQSISDNPTTIIWYNTSLPMDRCPKKEIEELHQMIISDERGSPGGALKEHVDQIFDKDFKVMSIRLIPLGLCAEQNTKTNLPVHTGTNVKGSKAGTAEANYTEYLVTFIIPIVVIVCMILVAGIIACVLYRRRRTGKMSVGDEEERQAFRSKGIPVIFQDELEEQAGTELLHKSPVIMREEKPPLVPPAPEYRTSAPYRPPPPVNASSTPPRPKATPTYRKPPPYVPP